MAVLALQDRYFSLMDYLNLYLVSRLTKNIHSNLIILFMN